MNQSIAILLTVILVFICSAEAQQPWNILDQFPVTPGWSENVKWNHEIFAWAYLNQEQLKNSAYRVAINATTPNNIANVFNRAFCAAARTVTILADCIYDAWIATSGCKSDVAKPYSGVDLNPQKRKWSDKDIKTALSYAAYTALYYNFAYLGAQPFQSEINATLVRLGYDLTKVSYNKLDTAYGVGIKACQLVVDLARKDGSNQEGNKPTTDPPGTPFGNYINYRPPQNPMPVIGKTNCDTLKYIDSWQPATVRAAVGSNTSTVRNWFDMSMVMKKPFALPCLSTVRPGPVPKNISTTEYAWKKRNQGMLDYSYKLDDLEKARANYFQQAEGYAGGVIWAKFTILAAQKSNLNLENSIKLFFLQSHTFLEAQMVQYEGKLFYDAPRPTTPVQCLFRNKQVLAWKGPYQGVGFINGSNWSAYLPDTLVQNATPEYPCGHCVCSGSTKSTMNIFFGSDKFVGEPITYLPGSFVQEPKLTAGYYGFIDGVTNVPNNGKGTVGYAPAKNVTLSWKSWSEVTKQAAVSRIYLGVHYDDSEVISYGVGEEVGRLVAKHVHKNYFRLPNIKNYCGDVE